MDRSEGRGESIGPLLERLLDNIDRSLTKLDSQTEDIGKTARSAFLRVEGVEDGLASVRESLHENVNQLRAEVEKVSAEARASTISLAEIKAVSKTAGKVAGMIAGAVAGVLGSILVAFILRLLHVS